MAVKLNSYINFNGNASEALAFYQSVFGGTVISDTMGEFAARVPESGMEVAEADKNRIMHAYLKGDNGIELMVSDTMSSMEPVKFEGAITLALNGDDEATLRGYWNKLSEGGQINMPLEQAPWSDLFGVVTDKFGITWMVDVGPEDPRLQ